LSPRTSGLTNLDDPYRIPVSCVSHPAKQW
jgi:hypothetical protein